MEQTERHSFQTKNEINFLNKLGTWVTHKPGNRVELLQKYLEVWHDRETWGEIDKIEAREYAFTLLSNERLMAVRS